MDTRLRYFRFFRLVVVVILCACTVGCTSDDDDDPLPPPVPSISNINSSADPKSPVDQAVEINGSNFLSSPGTVRFTESAVPTDVTPLPAAWSDSSIVAQVPSGLTPGATVQVTVITSNGESNAVDLDIVVVPSFGSSSSITWNNAIVPALPAGRRGLKAAVVPNTSTSAYLYVAGGQTGGATPANQDTAWRLGLSIVAGVFSTDPSWTTENVLPATRSFHGLVAAHGENSPVSAGSAYLFVIGGQAAATDAPGGTDTVYRAGVNMADGSLSAWTSVGTIPAPRLNHGALIYRGTLYVLGGNDASGNPVDTIFQARIGADGSLGSFTTSPTTLPVTLGSFVAVAFGGRLYTIGGETSPSTNPNDFTELVGDIRDSYRASITAGSIGSFVTDRQLGNERKKHVAWNVYGSILVSEGSEKGSSGSTTVADIQTDGSLSSWNGTTQPSDDVFNAAAVLAPIVPSSNGPRFIMLGGDDFAGNASTVVWVNTAP
ncbi:MAG: hypothetical protein ACYTFG_13255 [Planctomycetota bacterium]|jgi:hypothetical protein